MSAIEQQPTNRNFLGNNGFRFGIKNLPTVNYFCQSISIPSITMNAIDTATPFAYVPRPGDKITWDPLVIRFKVDEDLVNYFEIQKWIAGLGHPDDLTQTRDISKSIRETQIGNRPIGYYTTFTSDAFITILSSAKNANKTIFFYECFPTGLSQLDFESTNPNLEFIEATATFRYRKYQLDE